MRQATLIYNPVAGRNTSKRERQMQAAGAILREGGIAVKMARTTGPGSATELAKAAVDSGDDLVIACGGDGTLYEVVNGLCPSPVPLAILPGGTANIMANELGLPHDPVRAARDLHRWQPQRIALGRVRGLPALPLEETKNIERYFLSVAGIGFDAYVIRHLSFQFKMWLGVAAYVLEGFRQVMRYSFPPVVCQTDGREVRATFAIVQRTSLYAGWFRTAPKQSVTKPQFGLSLFPSSSRRRYFAYGMAVLAERRLRDVELIETSKISFTPERAGAEVLFELDGELAGRLPATFEVIPQALTLFMPPIVPI